MHDIKDECMYSTSAWLGVLCWCSSRFHGQVCRASAWFCSMVGHAMPVCGPLLWSGLLCWCWACLHRSVCCAGPWPVSMVGHVVPAGMVEHFAFVIGPLPW